MDHVITSLQNPKIKERIKLRMRRKRDELGLFLIEGYREIRRAVDAGLDILELFYCPELFLGENEAALMDAAHATPIEVSKSVFAKLSYRDRPDGLLAVAPRFSLELAHFTPKKCPFYVVVEAIEKPGNLGSILRSADAAGVDGLIVCDPCTDIFNPNVVRSSVGTLFTVPIAQAGAQEVFAFLRKRGVTAVAATPSASDLYTDIDMQRGVAITVGSEQYGLSDAWLEAADARVAIPMFGKADSLNVASATTLLLYEVVRQRRCR